MKSLIKFFMVLFFGTTLLLSCETDEATSDNFEDIDRSAMYGNWVRGNSPNTFVRFSGNTATTCVSGQQTNGTFNANEPSMTFVIKGETIKFPLKFNGNTMLMGVPNQAINTHNAQVYNKTDKFCKNSSGGGNNATTGNALFWTKSDLGCGNITVTINSQSRTISSYYSGGAPNCGASGSANFELPEGTYTFSANCSKYKWNSTIKITNGSCFKMELK